MRLYHGSNVSVPHPRILSDRRAMDFESGFYLTSDCSQAIKWTQIKTRRTGIGKAMVSVFQMDDKAFNKLSILSFLEPDKEWLAYVSTNRRDKYRTDDFDIVIGPVANDRTMPTINLYLRGYGY